MNDGSAVNGRAAAGSSRMWHLLRAQWAQHPVAASLALLALLAGVSGVALAYADAPGKEWVAASLLLPYALCLLENLLCVARGRAPAWPGWFTAAAGVNLALGLGSLHDLTAGMRAPAGLPSELVAAPVAAALALALPLVLPRVLQVASGLLSFLAGRLRLPAALFEVPRVYVLVVLAIAGGSAAALSEANLPTGWFLFGLALLAAAVAMALVHRHTLAPGQPGTAWLRFLPHLPLGTWLGAAPFTVLLNELIEPPPVTAISAMAIGTALGLAGTFYWSAQRLRRAPVAQRAGRPAERTDSIQAKVEHYVDVYGLSARLVGSIRRSDGGVFGVTGVRGAGKSALTRHVLHRLADEHLALEVTAPVRHDPNMGFFLAVCRSLCARVRDDLGPILVGPSLGAQAQVATRVRNVAIGILAAVALAALAVERVSPRLPGGDGIAAFGKESDDPLLGRVGWAEAYPLLVERRIVDHLLAQIDRALVEESEARRRISRATRYVLLPNPDRQRFLLLRQPLTEAAPPESAPRGAERDDIAFLRDLVDPDRLAPGVFLAGGPGGDALRREVGSDPGSMVDAWMFLSARIADHPAIAAPLRHLSRELRWFLLSSGPDADAAPSARTHNRLFLSHLILEAFGNADPKLSFDYLRLERFAEAVRVYRHLLDGDVVPRATSAATPGAPGAALTTDDLDQVLLDYRQPTIAVFWVAASAIALLLLAGPLWRSAMTLARTIVNRRYLDAYVEAQRFLETLAYRSSEESSAGVGFKGLSFGQKRTLAGRDLTLPGLTARYLRFVEKVRPLYNGKLVIAIDELDKVHDPEQVKALLTEIKGALFAEGTFYLISISEDAARSFRRRLASGRDIFESTFDDVIDIRRMGVEAAVEMLQDRERTGGEDERLPPECLPVAALFGGGIPREIIRAWRTLSYAMDDGSRPTRAWAAWVLLREVLDQWDDHLGESNLTGDRTIEVRDLAREATRALGDSPDAADYGRVFECVERCVDVVDPEGLRRSVGYLAEDQPVEGAAEVVRYRALASDLQLVLRVLILTHLCERIATPGADPLADADQFLHCHRALLDKPALAEVLLHGLRGQVGHGPPAARPAAVPCDPSGTCDGGPGAPDGEEHGPAVGESSGER